MIHDENEIEQRWQELLRSREEREKKDREEGPDPDSPTETGLTVAT